jgi:DNA-binding transcriptional MerR regulator
MMTQTTPTARPPATGWTIAELASQAGLTPDTIRYYERIGLLPPPPRTSGAHRRYGPAALDRIRFIRGARRLDLRLAEIRDLLSVRDTGTCPCEPAEPLLRRRIAGVDAEIERLSVLRRELVEMADALPTAECPGPSPGSWRPLATYGDRSGTSA